MRKRQFFALFPFGSRVVQDAKHEFVLYFYSSLSFFTVCFPFFPFTLRLSLCLISLIFAFLFFSFYFRVSSIRPFCFFFLSGKFSTSFFLLPLFFFFYLHSPLLAFPSLSHAHISFHPSSLSSFNLLIIVNSQCFVFFTILLFHLSFSSLSPSLLYFLYFHLARHLHLARKFTYSSFSAATSIMPLSNVEPQSPIHVLLFFGCRKVAGSIFQV